MNKSESPISGKRPVGRPRADGRPHLSKHAVFKTAAQMIARFGYAGASLRKIADQLDVSAPSILNMFNCLLYTSPSPRDKRQSRMPSSA